MTKGVNGSRTWNSQPRDELNGNLLTAAGAEFESALFEYLPTVVVGGQETEGIQVQYNSPGQDQVV